MDTVFTRAALYELVWQQPISKLAKQLGISDVGLSKACRRADIPLPERGYWARQLAGKTLPRPELPSRGLGKREEIRLGGDRYDQRSPTDEEILSMEIPAPPAFVEPMEVVIERARRLVGHIAIPRKMASLHNEIVRLLNSDEERLAKQQKYSYTWDGPIFTSSIERRRLRFLNALYLGLAKCGCKCWTSAREARDCYVRVGDQTVSFTLEHVGAKERQYNMTPEPIPEGAKLRVKLSWWQPPAGVPVSWEDHLEGSLENQATDIAVGLLVAGEWSYRTSLVRRHEYIVERRAALEEQARQRKREAERKRREREARIAKEQCDRLLADARAWKDAADIRGFVAAALASNCVSDPAWAPWALQVADELDPLRREGAR